ncbi:MAG: mevalonate kinase [bacterium]
MNTGYGFGKTILFGEHFVVYGLPALAAALDVSTTATITALDCEQSCLIDNRPKVPYFVPSKYEQYNNMLHRILVYMGIFKNIEITLAGNLIVMSGGIGASAAAAVAIARVINNYFNLRWSDEQINQAAHIGEGAIHGNPSGVDNTAALFGGVFLYRRELETTLFTRQNIKVSGPVNIVLADSGRVSDTSKAVADVAKLKEEKPEFVQEVFTRYTQLIIDVQEAIKHKSLIELGKLMNQNQELLVLLGLSCPELDRMIVIAREAGALGAKLTGSGQGGLMVALTPEKEVQKKVSSALRKAGYVTINTSIGG